jgi:hypothetical protein
MNIFFEKVFILEIFFNPSPFALSPPADLPFFYSPLFILEILRKNFLKCILYVIRLKVFF